MKSSTEILILLLCSLVIGCVQPSEQIKIEKTKVSKEQPLQFDTSKISIMPYDSTYQWILKGGTYSSLSSTDLKIIDSILPVSIIEFNEIGVLEYEDFNKRFPEEKLRLKDFTINLAEYKFQYMPFTNENGEKEVFINCFCIVNKSYWKKRFVFVWDGGKCFFKLRINLDKRLFYDFKANGYA